MDRAPARASGADASGGFQLDRFEWIRATELMALLRVVGRRDAGGGVDLSSALLVVTVGGESRRFAPLFTGPQPPEPRAGDEESRAVAFPVPLALVVDEGVRFELRPRPGQLIALGTPTEREVGSPLPPLLPAEELEEWRRQVSKAIAEGEELKRRVATLCRVIHERAGLEHQPPEPPAVLGPKAEASLSSLVEAVREGLSRVARLEARVATLEGDLRSRRPGGQGSGIAPE